MESKSSKTRRNVIGIVLVVAIGLLTWSIVAVQGGVNNINLGIEEYEKGNYAAAIEHYNTAIESDPNDALAYNNRGLAYIEVGESEQALKDYDKAIELKPDYTEAYFNRGLAYFNLAPLGFGDPEIVQKGIADLTKAIELDPEYADAYYNRGLGYNQFYHYYYKAPFFSEEIIGSHNMAVAEFNKALELDPNCVLAYAGLGNAYYRFGEWDKATEYYNKALEHEDLILKKVGEESLKEVYQSRGRNYAQFQRTHPDSISDYEKVMEFDPESMDAIVHLAGLTVGNRDYEVSLDYCEKGIALIEAGVAGPEMSLIYSYRGQCYLGLEEYNKALSDFETYFSYVEMGAAMPSGEVYQYMGLTYLALGETEKAKETFEKGIALVNMGIDAGGAWAAYGIPSLYISYWERGLCYLGLGEYDKAIDDFLKARENNPPINVYGKNFYVEATKNLGIAYMKMEDIEKAKSYFEEALEKSALPEFGTSGTADEVRELLFQLSQLEELLEKELLEIESTD